MNITHLFEMQEQLDQRIEIEHGLEEESLIERKVLALLVELGELANETRCFKFWSKKPSSTKDVVLEEYVDGIHFILSLGIEMNLQKETVNLDFSVSEGGLVPAFMKVYANIHSFSEIPSKYTYESLLSSYLKLGKSLHFSFEEIERAYFKKNTINHERQNKGY